MLNEAIRLVRVYHDMSKAELARELGFSRSFIGELEAGNKKVTVETLERYSSYFDIPVSSLMLFSERMSDSDFSENARFFVAKKIIKMLEWIATISGEKHDRGAEP